MSGSEAESNFYLRALGNWLIATGRNYPAGIGVGQGQAVGQPYRVLLNVTAKRSIQLRDRSLSWNAKVSLFRRVPYRQYPGGVAYCGFDRCKKGLGP